MIQSATIAGRVPHSLEGASGHIGVIDIGSNSVRFVVYDGLRRTPLPLFNEKVLCGLGRGVAQDGRIHDDAWFLAVVTLRRFSALRRAMKIDRVAAVATAAVREAKNGQAFVDAVERECGIAIHIISGEEEARLSAQGVLAGNPGADGLVGDLGGGSLELVEVGNGRQRKFATLPLGPLQLMTMTAGSRSAAQSIIDDALNGLPWLTDIEGRAVFVVGGVWRTLGRMHMEVENYPLHIVQEYAIRRDDARSFAGLIAAQSRKSLERTPGISKRRIDTIPYGAMVLDRLLKATGANRLVFSSYGLREGLLYDHLPDDVRAQDPLLSACKEKGQRLGRFLEHADEMMAWTAPLFPDESPASTRIRLAACYLSDIGWRVHPDYRAHQSFMEVLRAPLVAIDHAARVTLALAIYFRYRADPAEQNVLDLIDFVGPDHASLALQIGVALRLGHTLSGATPGILGHCRFLLKPKTLILQLPQSLAELDGESVRKRLGVLGRSLERETKVVLG